MSFRLATVSGRAVLVDGDHYVDLERASANRLSSDPMAAIASFRELHDVDVAGVEPAGSIADAVLDGTLGPPVPSPGQVFAIGLNYADHVAETGREAPAVPVVFTKFPTCVGGPGDEIVIPNETIDYEAEMVVVIGEGGRDIAAADAWDHIAGVTGGQDVSDRALQFAATPAHFALAKSRRHYGPIGPVLCSVDALDDRNAIPVECLVDGEVRQSSTTEHLIFDVPTLVEYLSAIVELRPGDLIFTGTPSGVGRAIGRMLTPGQVVETRIGGVGAFTNPCVAPTL